ncbi:hypothetical protein JQX13_18880 [Archangium violaceum]|uniref:hypothetical protein n=1 Tax=Archangium violaceum TaxID=83451 RepID=UPI00193B33FB|nr:hypothetical protein [Archangium violaceum]QRK11935.1 hypothetical protein JQX13_18880 [Archangium violaceum]
MTSRLPPGSKSVVLLCLLLLLTPRGGLAAEDAPLASPTSNTEEHGPTLLEDPASGSLRRRAPLALRLLAEVGGGVATTLAGGLTGLGLCLLTESPVQSEWGCAYPLLFGLTAGLLVGYPLGVWWGGEAVGGDGSLWAALGGGAVGFIAGGLLEGTTAGGGMVIAIPVLGMIGASLGYELSQRPEHPERSAAHPRLQPLLAFDARGGMLGLSGRF